MNRRVSACTRFNWLEIRGKIRGEFSESPVLFESRWKQGEICRWRIWTNEVEACWLGGETEPSRIPISIVRA